MPHKYFWTLGQDTQIRRRRVEGASWETIAAELALPPDLVIRRGWRIHAPQPKGGAGLQDPMRDPLPAGHPDTWGRITAGTVLEGAPYPLRHFRR